MRRPRPPLAGIARLYVDGHNVLYRLAGAPDVAALRLLVVRLRVRLPAATSVVVALDGPPTPGLGGRHRLDPRLQLRHATTGDADSLLVELVTGLPLEARAATAVVTDDRALADRVRRIGGAVRSVAWLQGVLDAAPARVAPGTALGGPRRRATAAPDRPAQVPDDRSDGDERVPWHAGRRATVKRGNPHRGH